MRSVGILNADAANAAGVIGCREHGRPITAHTNDCSMLRISCVFVHGLFFPCSSLSREAALVGALARGHRFGEVSIECGANFFEPNLQMLSSPALDGSRESPCVEEHESAGPDSDSTKTVRRKGLLSMFAIPFADFSVGIETILLIECGPLRVGLAICRLLVGSRTVVEAQQ